MAQTKTSAKKRATAPQPGQLNAIRRCIAASQWLQARQRLAALRQSCPEFKPLLGLAWEIESEAGLTDLALLRAWQWSQALPGSRQALDVLLRGSLQQGSMALAIRAQQRLDELVSGSPQAPVVDVVDGPFGSISLAQGEAIELSALHLADDDPEMAAAVLQGVDHPSGRNNLAMAQFGNGQVRQACDTAEAAWRMQPANLFGLERHVRWRCWLQGMPAAAEWADVLRTSTPRRPEDATARVSALAFSRRHRGIHPGMARGRERFLLDRCF